MSSSVTYSANEEKVSLPAELPSVPESTKGKITKHISCSSILKLIPIITVIVFAIIALILAIVWAQPTLAVFSGIGLICSLIVFYQVFQSLSSEVVSRLKQSLKHLEKTNDDLTTTNTELKETNTKLQEQVLSLEEQIKSLELIANKFSLLKNLFSENNSEFKQNILLLKDQIDNLSLISQDSKEIRELVQQSTSLLKELVAWGDSTNREEMRELRREILNSIQLLKEEKESLKQENKDLQDNIQKNEVLLTQLTTQVSCFRNQLIQLSGLLDTLNLSLTQLGVTHIDLTKTKEELQLLTDSLKTEIEKLKKTTTI